MVWEGGELNRGTRLPSLQLHAMAYLPALEDDEILGLIRDWVRQNPGGRPEYWLSPWNSWALSIRTVAWMREYARRPALRAAGDVLCQSLFAQVRFLEHNLEMDIGGNHLVKNAKALLWAGRFFTGSTATRWRSRGERILGALLETNILADGFQFERSPAYHAQVLADLVDCLPLGGASLQRSLASAIRRMSFALACVTHPDGFIAQFNDGGLHMAPRLSTILAGLARAGQPPLYPMPNGAFALPDSGYFGVKDEAGYVLVDCGDLAPPEIPAHAHGDALSFEWSLGAQRVVVDQGVFEYSAGELRALARGTAMHNTATVDMSDQAEFWGAFRMGRRPTVRLERLEMRGNCLCLTGSHDGFGHLRGRPRHRRKVTASPTWIEVSDEFEGGVGQIATASLLLHPDVHVVALWPDGAELLAGRDRISLSCQGVLTSRAAEWWPDLGVRCQTTRLMVTYGRVPCRGAFVLRAE